MQPDLLIWGLTDESINALRAVVPDIELQILSDLPQNAISTPLLVGHQIGLEEWLKVRGEEKSASVLLYGGLEKAQSTGLWAYCNDLIAPNDWDSVITHLAHPDLLYVREAVYDLPADAVTSLHGSSEDFDLSRLPIPEKVRQILNDDAICHAEFCAHLEHYRHCLNSISRPVAVLAFQFAQLMNTTRERIRNLISTWTGEREHLHLAFSAFLEGLNRYRLHADIPRSHSVANTSDISPEALIDALSGHIRVNFYDLELFLTYDTESLKLMLESNNFADVPFRLELTGGFGARVWHSQANGKLSIPISEWLSALAEGADHFQIIPIQMEARHES